MTRLLRADSGFSDAAFLDKVESLKYDFGSDSFCLRDFWATEASLNMTMVAYNLMSLFRQAAMRTTVKRKADLLIENFNNYFLPAQVRQSAVVRRSSV